MTAYTWAGSRPFKSKEKLDRISCLCIIDSPHGWRLFEHGHEKDEFLFSRDADQKAEGTSKKNWPSAFRYFEASNR